MGDEKVRATSQRAHKHAATAQTRHESSFVLNCFINQKGYWSGRLTLPGDICKTVEQFSIAAVLRSQLARMETQNSGNFDGKF